MQQLQRDERDETCWNKREEQEPDRAVEDVYRIGGKGNERTKHLLRQAFGIAEEEGQ